MPSTTPCSQLAPGNSPPPTVLAIPPTYRPPTPANCERSAGPGPADRSQFGRLGSASADGDRRVLDDGVGEELLAQGLDLRPGGGLVGRLDGEPDGLADAD